MSEFTLPNAARLTVYADADALALAVAHRIAELVNQILLSRDVFRIALAGGETPRRCYRQLQTLPLDWARIHVYFGDERCLPVGDAQRNDSMASESLLQHVGIPPVNIHPIQAEQGATIGAERYSLELAQCDALDLVLLGMGEDGHTASLFPDNSALHSKSSAVPVFDAPKAPPQRVSLGLATLNAARHKLFLVAGKGKREPLQRIAQGEQLPAAQVLDAEWYLDVDALPPQ